MHRAIRPPGSQPVRDLLRSPRWLRLLVLSAILLAAFALYAPAARLMTFNPLAFQAVLWSAAVVHEQVTLFGLAATWAYLVLPEHGRRWAAGWAVVAVLLATYLSHGQGPNFGLFVLWAEVMRAVATRTRFRHGSRLVHRTGMVGCLHRRPHE